MALQLEFSGSHEIDTPRQGVWQRLVDPHFVTQSIPGVQSLDTVAPGHFRVASVIGLGFMRLDVTMDIELFDLVEPERAQLRAKASAAGSSLDVLSAIRLEAPSNDATGLHWTATAQVDGTLAAFGGGMVESVTQKLTSEFWADFVRRVEAEGKP